MEIVVSHYCLRWVKSPYITTVGQHGSVLTRKVDGSCLTKTSALQQLPMSSWNVTSTAFTSATTFYRYHQDVGVAKALEPIQFQLIKDASHCSRLLKNYWGRSTSSWGQL